MSLSRCSSWPKLSLHYTDINNIMYAVKTLYKLKSVVDELNKLNNVQNKRIKQYI